MSRRSDNATTVIFQGKSFRLSACPFCGSNKGLQFSFDDFPDLQFFMVYCGPFVDGNTIVAGCGGNSGLRLTAEEAAEAWNREPLQ